MLDKESIAVYSPQDPLEKYVQDTYHQYNDDWLISSSCQLATKAIISLKMYSRWLDDEHLIESRMRYFFDLKMTERRNQVVFLTFPLYLRDILENEKIDSFLHCPIVFVAPRIAYWIFKEYPVHIYLNESALKAENGQTKFLSVGGLNLVENADVKITKSMIDKIRTIESHDLIADIVKDYDQKESMKKAAEIEILRDIFKITNLEKDLQPNLRIWNKSERIYGTIESVQPGEVGEVEITYDNGSGCKIGKNEFELQHTVV